MYLLIVFGLMLVLPLLSIAVEATLVSGTDPVFLVGKWFVFYAGGLRLLLAGASQIVRPQFTARSVFGIKDAKASRIVSELGFANVSIGLLCMLSLAFPEWVLPGAIVSGLFYGLAGGKHFLNGARGGTENIAMVTDLAMVGILGLYVLLESL
jgi:hypothetical protein